MQDYESWSDQQISTEVAIRVNFTRLLPARLLGRNLHKLTLEDFDPCNSTADAWPIIVESKIGGHYSKATPDLYFAVSRDERYMAVDANPLRAKMIVFLMMTDNVM